MDGSIIFRGDVVPTLQGQQHTNFSKFCPEEGRDRVPVLGPPMGMTCTIEFLTINTELLVQSSLASNVLQHQNKLSPV